jgi:Nodulation protein Z (NodZ)
LYTAGTRQYFSANTKHTVEPILLVKGIAGLGNRILCLLTASLYARLSGRKLIVDWRDENYSSGAVNAFHHFFQSPLCVPADQVPETYSVAPAIWRGRVRESAWSMKVRYGSVNDAQGWRPFSIDLSRLDYSERVAVMWTYTDELDPLIPHLQAAADPLAQADRSVILRTLLGETLTLHPEIRGKVDEFKRDHFKGRTVGVHVRYTDHRTALWATLVALHRLLERDPACRIFLCTDNIQVKRLFEEKNQTVISTPHWYASIPGRPLHVGSYRPDPIVAGIEALTDLYLLAQCDELIVDTSSSFGFLATLLTNAPRARVCDVKRGDKLPPRMRNATTRLMRRFCLHSWAPAIIGKLVGQPRLAAHGQPARQ